MAEICCSETSASCEPRSRAARRRRMDIRRFKFVAGEAPESGSDPCSSKRQKLEVSYPATSSRECENAVESSERQEAKQTEAGEKKDNLNSKSISSPAESPVKECFPKFGMTSVIGRRRDMEDAVSIHPFFCQQDRQVAPSLHFFGVFDGHGCSHVATRCKERMHNLVAEEVERRGDWKESMERSFSNMDGEVTGTGNSPLSNCRCELQSPKCDAVGSTAVVAVVSPEKIVVANCGDSRAVLCRKGKAVPLSSDHKPDRPDELERIQAAGGRVIYWDGPRVLGVLAMSRAIGDTYLKPFVSSIPEVTVTERSPDDECLILASDGLWDVVSNDTACEIAGMCLRGQSRSSPESESSSGAGGPDKVCSDAAMLLTKLALARQSSDNVSVVVVDLHKEI